jgi:glucose dehydrogenase
MRAYNFNRFGLGFATLGIALSAPLGCSDDAHPREPQAVEMDDAAVPPEVSANARDWPLPNADYDNTRRAPGSRIDSSNVSQLHEVWRLPLECVGPFGCVTSNPLVMGDTVFIQDMASNVFALARDSGEPRWVHHIDALTPGPNGVAVGWGKLFANLGDTGILALDSSSGDELWRFEPTLVQSEGIDVQPIVYGGRVFVSTVPASSRGIYLGGSRGIIQALDAESGEVRWRFDTVDSEDAWGNPDVNGGGGAWYPPLIDPMRGLTFWGTGNPLPWPGTPDHPGGSSRPGPNLYTSSVVALGLEDGALAWYHQERAHDLFDGDFQNSPIHVRTPAGESIIGSGKTGTVVSLAVEDGALQWRAKVGEHQNDEQELSGEPIEILPGALGGVLTPPAYADGVVYVPVVDLVSSFTSTSFSVDFAQAKGVLVALDARDGSELWSVQLPAAAYGAATVVNDLVLTSDASGRVYAFARDSGEEVWHFDAGGGINAPLAVAGDLVLIPVGLDNPALIALRL